MSSRATAASEAPILLEMRNISKSFGAHKALHGVRIAVRAGEVHALMGENGAGKSTLTSILCGIIPPDPGGEIVISGAAKAIRNPIDARRLGIAIIHQELALADNLTVMENMTLGDETAYFGFRARAKMRARCEPVLQRLGLAWARDRKVGTLSIAEQQMVEIARALMADARVIVMDEPTTSLSLRETDRLFGIVRELRAEGRAIIYISHRMNEIYELADRVSVLRDGTFIGELDRRELGAEKLISMMVGRDLSTFYTKGGSGRMVGYDAPIVLSVDGVGDGKGLGPCSLELRAGEIVGLAGLVGAGRTELARLIFGAERPKSGTITLNGKPLQLNAPVDAIDAGIAYLTEDRKGLGLLLDMSVHSNINLNVLADDAWGTAVLNASAGAKRSAEAIAAMNIRVRGADTIVGTLSGGNQQKVLLARLLQRKPKVILLDEPTRGVDVGAKSEIYKIINNLAAEGAAVLVISSELPELIGLSDRVLVMREGRIAGEVDGSSGVAISQEAIIGIATGSDAITARA
ncbi:sugar ABC transporter ATP-binding protein [Shinella sedimenti]|uniref:Sugar ABC transporter ATP-binding protein n=1 Tax=Shinella sedimenti TaxID=2919913 RepID=A0ABT0CQ64_9HYPH|nr:sugar ABC transporter ATP-binding protein [Shinella sedimenti]MCJ8150753.1 sugar ABC transporter ATP-binding protein [Shinella sedimenti]